MALSSGVVWRHRELGRLPPRVPRRRRACCSGSSGSGSTRRSPGSCRSARRSSRRGTGNPRTAGIRFDPRGARRGAARRGCGRTRSPRRRRCRRTATGPRVLATGGFAASPELVARHIRPAAPLRLRGNPWSTGGGLERGARARRRARRRDGRVLRPQHAGRRRGARPTSSRPRSSTRRHARIFDERGEEFFHAGDVSWSETNVVAATARRDRARGRTTSSTEDALSPRDA